MDQHTILKGAAVFFAFASAGLWFWSARGQVAPIGMWGDSPIVVQFEEDARFRARLSAAAAVCTGLSVVLQALT